MTKELLYKEIANINEVAERRKKHFILNMCELTPNIKSGILFAMAGIQSKLHALDILLSKVISKFSITAFCLQNNLNREKMGVQDISTKKI